MYQAAAGVEVKGMGLPHGSQGLSPRPCGLPFSLWLSLVKLK